MDKYPALLYKTLIVGVIILLNLTIFPVTTCISAPNNTSKCGWVPFDNLPPEPPEIDGPTNWPPGVEICFTFRSFDPNHDDIKLLIDWGDGAFEETNYFQHDIPIQVSHTYEEIETYLLQARGIDIYGYEGEWSTFYIPINDDECEICPKVSKNHIDRLINVLDKLDKQDKDTSASSIQNHKVKEEIQGLSVKINTLEKPSLNSSICDFLYKYFVYNLFKYMLVSLLIDRIYDTFYPFFSISLNIFYTFIGLKTLFIASILSDLSTLFDCPEWDWYPPYMNYNTNA